MTSSQTLLLQINFSRLCSSPPTTVKVTEHALKRKPLNSSWRNKISKKYEIHRRGCEHVGIETLYAAVGFFRSNKTLIRVKGLSPSTLSKSAVFVKKTALEPSRSLAQLPWHKATRSINTFPPDVMLIYRRITPQHFIRLPSKFTGTLESKMFCPRTQHNDQVSNPVLSNCFPPYLPLGILATHHCLPM